MKACGKPLPLLNSLLLDQRPSLGQGIYTFPLNIFDKKGPIQRIYFYTTGVRYLLTLFWYRGLLPFLSSLLSSSLRRSLLSLEESSAPVQRLRRMLLATPLALPRESSRIAVVVRPVYDLLAMHLQPRRQECLTQTQLPAA